tara:strand:+ start:3963 stop:4946 length:984 start_codon:yes stop_codon:yes gene_type:complete
VSESKSGIVSVKPISEGSTLDKKEINDTVDSWLEASENISGKNIREEGLDRRVFKSNETWSQDKGSTSDTTNGFIRHLNLDIKKVNAWQPVKLVGGSGSTAKEFSNGAGSPEVCAIKWEWDPNLDSYCIIRCSFFFYWDIGNFGHTGRDSKGNLVRNDWRADQFYKFGIAVKRFDDDPGAHGINDFISGNVEYKGVRRIDNPKGDIFACQQIGLNNDWSAYTSKRGPIQFDYDRRTAMSSSFTLVASGSSGENNTTFKLDNNMCAIDMRKAGTYVAVLVVRPKKIDIDIQVGGGGGSQNGISIEKPYTDNSFPECGFFNMHAQAFRR